MLGHPNRWSCEIPVLCRNIGSVFHGLAGTHMVPPAFQCLNSRPTVVTLPRGILSRVQAAAVYRDFTPDHRGRARTPRTTF